MNAVGVIVLVVVVFLVVGTIGWVVYSRIRSQRLGLPPPSLSSYIPFVKSSSFGSQRGGGGVVGWISNRIRSLKSMNSRTAAGAYEQASGARNGRRGFGPLDPDEAWDSRVGYEADAYGAPGPYEEQELGLASPYHGGGGSGSGDIGYGGSSYAMNLASAPVGTDARSGFAGDEENDRGRTRSRSPGFGPGLSATTKNPFDDDADPSNLSMRAVSPRPIDTAAAAADGRAGHKDRDSPSERRSVFREDV